MGKIFDDGFDLKPISDWLHNNHVHKAEDWGKPCTSADQVILSLPEISEWKRVQMYVRGMFIEWRIEKTETGYSAYIPDLPGCIATGSTKKEVEKNMAEAIEFHLDGLECSSD